MAEVRCRCHCHLYALGDRDAAGSELAPHVVWALAQAIKEWDGVDVNDPLEAAVACPDCLPRHCPALLEKRAWAPMVSQPEILPPYQASPDATGGDDGEQGG